MLSLTTCFQRKKFERVHAILPLQQPCFNGGNLTHAAVIENAILTLAEYL
jgi:hypothetical protein